MLYVVCGAECSRGTYKPYVIYVCFPLKYINYSSYTFCYIYVRFTVQKDKFVFKHESCNYIIHFVPFVQGTTSCVCLHVSS